MAKTKALFPGSFDPFTNGHLDVVETASRIFDAVHISIGRNAAKKSLLSIDERLECISEAVAHLENVSVGAFSGLVADYVGKEDASIIVRGLRQATDFEYEQRMAIANDLLGKNLPTVFLTPHLENLLTSSTIVRDIYRHGGDFGHFVPGSVRSFLEKKRSKQK
ncbi:MAG: pantetheine-phosphate adenylyltransferase [Rhodothermales bacterium]|nr:pantetheine-phosphate adenylyltransferase [Rhodothermales bacterium]